MRAWQQQSNSGSLSDLALNLHPAARLLRETVNLGKPQPRSRVYDTQRDNSPTASALGPSNWFLASMVMTPPFGIASRALTQSQLGVVGND
jgi:hypothetical protein